VPAAVTTTDVAVAGAEADTAAEDAEVNGSIQVSDPVGQEHPGSVEEEQPSQEQEQEVEDDHDGNAGHEEQAYEEERGHEDSPPEADAMAEADADPTPSQSLTAEDKPDVGEDVLSEQPAPPGEGDAEHSVSETEAKAASDHQPEAKSMPEGRLDEVKSRHAAVGDGLEDVVNMLQGGHSFPPSTYLVVAGEIPDED
jgi:hypothetical protein